MTTTEPGAPMIGRDYNAQIAAIDARRPGFARVIDGLLTMAERTGRIDENILADLLSEGDQVALDMVAAVIESRLELIGEAGR